MKIRNFINEVRILLVWVVIVGIFSFISPNFFQSTNAIVLLLNGSIIALITLSQSFVLLTGGIDLSTGAVISMTGIIAASFMRAGLAWYLAAFLATLFGALMGTFNGLIIHYFGIPPFIVTFAAMGVASSIPMIITRAESISIADQKFLWFGQGSILGLPVPIVIVFVCAILAALILKSTIFGTHIYALGGNRQAARLSGVNIMKTTVLVYALSGFLAGLAGVVATSRLGVAYPQTGTGDQLFYSIASAVVGGVSLFGGIGKIRGAMTGVLLIATISNGMNVIAVSSYWQPLVIGLIILAGVGFDGKRGAGSEKEKKSISLTSLFKRNSDGHVANLSKNPQ
jgi:ribose transport system permease protein